MIRIGNQFIVAFLSLIVTKAFCADEPLWKKVGHWQIRVDTTLNNGCFLYTSFERGTILRIGLDKTATGGGYIIIGNDDWKSIEVGKDYKISIKFDDELPWVGN